MVRGNKPKVSDTGQRMVTWRIPANLHKLLIEVTNYLGMSHNRFLTEQMTVKLHELKAKIDETEAKKNAPKDE